LGFDRGWRLRRSVGRGCRRSQSPRDCDRPKRHRQRCTRLRAWQLCRGNGQQLGGLGWRDRFERRRDDRARREHGRHGWFVDGLGRQRTGDQRQHHRGGFAVGRFGPGRDGAGRLAQASGLAAVAVGFGAQASGDGSVAIGWNSIADAPNTVSFGGNGVYRELVNLASPTTSHSAVTLGYLQSNYTTSAVTNEALANLS